MYPSRSLPIDARRILSALAVAFLCLSGWRPSLAQSIQGSIIGTIEDKAGAVVPGATLTLQNLDEGSTRTTTSNASGDYQFLDAKAGHYSLLVQNTGFEKWQTTGVLLASRQQLRIDVKLVVGSVQQEVDVSADTISAINTENPSISAVYSSAEAANLPVNTRASANGTSPLNIVGTLPGVQADHGTFSLQGGLPFQTEVSVDGITVQSATGNSPIADAFPSTESISELRADGAMNNAEFGQPGEITVISKAGTNTIHGSAFWYHQNAAFDAIPYTFPITTTKPKLIGNTYGGAFGGPVVLPHLYNGHNRTFVFGAYEGWRHPSQTTELYKVPSTLMKKGDFSKVRFHRIHRAHQSVYRRKLWYGPANIECIRGEIYCSSILTRTSEIRPHIPTMGHPTTSSIRIRAGTRINSTFGVINTLAVTRSFCCGAALPGRTFPPNTFEPLAVPSAQNTNQTRVLKISANYTITPRIINEFGFGYTFSTTGTSNSFDGKAFTEGLGPEWAAKSFL